MTVTSTNTEVLAVDFHLDLVCPWCWIGLRNLRAALASWRELHPHGRWQMRWHAAPLLPQIPDEGVPYQAFYEARLGSPQAVQARRAQVQAVAHTAGLHIQFEAIGTFSASRLACALIDFAHTRLPAERMFVLVESIFASYFEQGRDVGQPEVLQPLALAAGLDWSPTQAPRPASGAAHIGGVPRFVFNGSRSVTGAVPHTELLQAMRRP